MAAMRTSKKRPHPKPRLVVAGLALSLLTSCVQHGPGAIQRARFDYNEAIIRTWNEQMLLNLVRLRYRDTPFFLEVQAVSTQYEFEGNLSGGTTIDLSGGNDDDLGLSAGVGYSERPTVSYLPLQGDRFATQLMSPLPVESLELLALSGWGIDRIYRAAVQSINGIDNAPSASGPTPEYAPEFAEFSLVVDMLRQLQSQRGLSVTARVGEDGQRRLFLRFRPISGAQGHQCAELRELLGLRPSLDEYEIVPGPTAARDDAIAIETRSLMSVMFFLSHTVDPPEAHVAAGSVTETVTMEGAPFDWSALGDGLFRVHASESLPRDAFTRVRYRDHWYFIRDDDLDTKSTFGLLAQLFNLQAGQQSGGGPLLTLPVGG